MMNKSLQVVGHRGFPVYYPENTAIGFEAACRAGVAAVELDVHLSRDGVPVVIHDLHLDRTSDQRGSVTELDFAFLQHVSCHYPDRFGERFHPQYLQSLSQACQLLASWSVQVFIELKRKSIPLLGREAFVKNVLQASNDLGARRKLISFDREILQVARSQCDLPLGWCLENFESNSYAEARELCPEMLVCKPSVVGEAALWPGDWDWFIYDIESHQQAKHWQHRGAHWIEADDPAAVLTVPGEPDQSGDASG